MRNEAPGHARLSAASAGYISNAPQADSTILVSELRPLRRLHLHLHLHPHPRRTTRRLTTAPTAKNTRPRVIGVRDAALRERRYSSTTNDSEEGDNEA